jgi:dTDP-4-dehydrorhamnose reductase
MSDLELWGGHECTVNRVGDRYFDQSARSGHADRIEDLELFAALGLKALRYPVLWERVGPDQPGDYDWRWTDERLGEIRRLGMRPIAGLIHHGSGPRFTSLIADSFPSLFADYARAAAERYPWLEAWTPVNEPLTTARFSALYGHWYPHTTDERLFWVALLNQVDATRMAMRQIRTVNPDAKLIQTEDLGQTYSTPPLADQAAFENHRRWLTWDLLVGRVTKDHPFWARFKRFGLADRLRAIADDPCPPDVMGVNHYLTSERFLDHRTELYPPHRVGGNNFVSYADVEAIRVMRPGPAGLAGLLEQTWERYGLPMAVTESHNGCTREEQMRWTFEAWRSCQRLADRGVDVRAVTAWALLGSYYWNSLLTREDGHYEPGAFDLRGGAPRPTAHAQMLRALANDQPVHPAVNAPGWWRRDVRIEFQPVLRTAEALPPPRAWEPEQVLSRPVLITGATGTLGQALARACELRGLPYILTDRRQLPLDDQAGAEQVIARCEPWAVINAAGWVRVDDAETDEEACHAANARGAANLAQTSPKAGVHYTAFSSDLVFDGALDRPYVETDEPRPLNAYGRSKAEAERQVLAAGGDALVVRTAAFFSPDDPYNFAAWIMRELKSGRAAHAAADCVITPTYVPHLAQAVLDLIVDGETGIRHLSSGQPMSWAEFGRFIARALDLDARLVRPTPSADLGWTAVRPRRAALGTRLGVVMPSFEEALGRYAMAVKGGLSAAEVEAEVRREALEEPVADGAASARRH